MINVKDQLKIGSIINFIVAGAHILKFANMSSVYSLLSIVLTSLAGIYLYILSEKEEYEIKKMNWIIIIFSILLIPFNLISTIVYFLAYDKTNTVKNFENAPPKEDEVSSDSKRLDFVLKLGAGMVVLSGIIFATSNWNSISAIVKTVLVFLLGLLFLGLYYVSKKYIKVEQSTRLYYLLSMIFIWLGVFTIKFISPYSEMFIFEKKYIFYGITSFIAAIMFLLSYKLFKSELLRILTTMAIILGASFIGIYFKAGKEFIVLFVFLVLIIEYLFNKKNELLSNFIVPVTLVLGFINPWICAGGNQFIIIINLTLLFYLIYLIKDKRFGYLTSIIIPINLSFTVLTIDINSIYKDGSYMLAMTTLGVGALLLFIFIKSLDKDLFTYISSHLSVLLLTVGGVWSLIFENTLVIIYCTIIPIIVGIVGLIKNKDDKLLYPLSFLLFIPVGNILYKVGLSYEVSVIIVSLLYLGINYFKDFKLIRYTNIALIVYALFVNALGTISVINYSILALCLVVNYFELSKEKKEFRSLMFIFTELAIFACLSLFAPDAKEVLHSSLFFIMANVATIIIFIALGYFYRKNKFNLIVTLIAVLLPILRIFDYVDISRTLNVIIISLYAFSAIYIISKYLIEEEKTRKEFALLAVIFVLFRCLLYLDTAVCFYLIIVSLGLIYIGLKDKNYSSLTITGIVTIIISTLFELREYLEYIPFWIYLLVVGLSLIGIVTYLQFKRK